MSLAKSKIPQVIKKRRKKVISHDEIRARLLDLDIVQTSTLRDLDLDILGLQGHRSADVLAEARKVFAKAVTA